MNIILLYIMKMVILSSFSLNKADTKVNESYIVIRELSDEYKDKKEQIEDAYGEIINQYKKRVKRKGVDNVDNSWCVSVIDFSSLRLSIANRRNGPPFRRSVGVFDRCSYLFPHFHSLSLSTNAARKRFLSATEKNENFFWIFPSGGHTRFDRRKAREKSEKLSCGYRPFVNLLSTLFQPFFITFPTMRSAMAR